MNPSQMLEVRAHNPPSLEYSPTTSNPTVYTKGGKTKNPSPISWSASLSSLFALGGSLVTVLTGNKLL